MMVIWLNNSNKYYAHDSTYIDKGVDIGENTKIWHFSHVSSGVKIGTNCTFGQNVFIAPNVKIGNFCKVQNNVSLYEGVELADYVFCGPSMVFTNIQKPRCKYPQRGSVFYVRTLVGKGASICANATIVCGHDIGKHAFIAAGAVITKTVLNHALMVGVPAKRIGWVCECGDILPTTLICPKCDKYYIETPQGLEEKQHAKN